jgi:hypothetical protein
VEYPSLKIAFSNYAAQPEFRRARAREIIELEDVCFQVAKVWPLCTENQWLLRGLVIGYMLFARRHDRVRDILEFLTLRENHDYHAHHRRGARLSSPRRQKFCDPTDKTRGGWEDHMIIENISYLLSCLKLAPRRVRRR